MRRNLLAAWALALAMATAGLTARAGDGFAALPASDGVSAATLEKAIENRLTRVEEFRFVREAAEKLGLRVYLFGGTAAAFAHYVKWDLEREAGDTRYQRNRFDYDYTSIYRSTQDLDLVVDGSPDAKPEEVKARAAQLERELALRYHHVGGAKIAWEIRLLREKRGDKEALLGNPDYLNQHTDSNSTGLIEVTVPPSSESAIRDLKDWDAPLPRFLEDVSRGKLHYYFSANHDETSRAKKGLNPPIVSVIRCLTKAFQYGLEIEPPDWEDLRRIVEAFDPERDLGSSYVRDWIERNGKKLYTNAVNVEYARDVLDRLGLREKLARFSRRALPRDPRLQYGSLAWWMGKEPLRSRPVGEGDGPTARELGLSQVAHETNSFLAYEAITRSPIGAPNVFVSRPDVVGEAALHGPGFYTRVGREGARGTGLTIRFTLDPSAREGTDFKRVEDYVVVLNREALRVIPESLDITPVEFFRMCFTYERPDLGLMERLKRRIGPKLFVMRPEEYDQVLAIVRVAANTANDPRSRMVLETWFHSPASVRAPEVLESLVRRSKHGPEFAIALYALGEPHWAHSRVGKDAVAELFRTQSLRPILVSEVLTRPAWAGEEGTRLVLGALEKGGGALKKISRFMFGNDLEETVAEKLFAEPAWQRAPGTKRIAKRLLSVTGDLDIPVARHLLSQPGLASDPWGEQLFETLLSRGHSDEALARYVLSKPEWAAHPSAGKWIEALFARVPEEVITYTLPEAAWASQPVGIRLVRAALRQKLVGPLLSHVFSQTAWMDQPWMMALLKELVAMRIYDTAIITSVLSRPGWEKRPEVEAILRELMTHPSNEALLAQYVFSSPEWAQDPRGPRFLKELIKGGRVDNVIAGLVLPKPHWAQHPEAADLIDALLSRPSLEVDFHIIEKILTQRGWASSPRGHRIIDRLLERGTYDFAVAGFLLSSPTWASQADAARWLEAIVRRSSNAEASVLKNVLSQPFWAASPKGLEILEYYVRKKGNDYVLDDEVLSKPFWQSVLKAALHAEGPFKTKDLRRALAEGKTLVPKGSSPLIESLSRGKTKRFLSRCIEAWISSYPTETFK